MLESPVDSTVSSISSAGEQPTACAILTIVESLMSLSSASNRHTDTRLMLRRSAKSFCVNLYFFRTDLNLIFTTLHYYFCKDTHYIIICSTFTLIVNLNSDILTLH